MKTTSQLLKSIYLSTSLFALSLFSNVASATQMFQPSNVVGTDLSQKYLNMIFGEVGPLTGTVKSTIIGDMMGVWCSGVLLVSCIATFCYIVQGTIQTAHEGEPLGQKWSSVWVPARLAISLAMIVPTAGGYCLIQSAIMWCALQGVNLADLVWNTAADSLYNRGGMLTYATPTAGFNVASKLLIQMTCVEEVNKQIQEMNAAVGPSNPSAQISEIGLVYLGTNQIGGFGWGHAEGVGPFSPKTCGGMYYLNSSGLYDATGQLMPASESQQYEIEKLNAQKKAVFDMIGVMKPVITDMVYNNVMPKPELFNTWADVYNKSINDALKSSALVQKYVGLDVSAGSNGTMTNLATLAKKDGWIAAGSYFSTINSINAKVQDFANVKPSGISINFDIPAMFDEGLINAQIEAAEYLSQEASEYNQTGLQESYKKSRGDTSSMGYDGYEKSKKLMDYLGESFSSGFNWMSNFGESLQNGVINIMTSSESNPIIRMEMLGHWAMYAGEAYYGAQAISLIAPTGRIAGVVSKTGNMVSNIGKAAGKDPNAAGGLGGFGLMNTVAIGLTGVGLLLSVYAPMLPYIMFTFGVLSWFFAVVIAMTAGPVFAMGHASPEGHEMAGGAMNGYSLLLGVTLRPTLMLFGMFFAMLVMYAGDKLLTNGFMMAFAGTQSDTIHGLVTAVAGLVMYGILSFIMVHACFKLITKIPDSVLQWAGHANDNDALGVEEQTHNTRGVIINGSRSATSSLSQGMAQKGNHEDNKEKKRNADLAPKPQTPSNNNNDGD